MSGHPTVGDAVGARLAHLGVEAVFGVLGSGNLVVTNALRSGGARFLAARHENGATCMAAGWSAATGRVGVCSVHQGPGLTNALTGLAEAAKSRTPLLVLAGDTPAAALTSNFRIDQHDLVTSVGAIAERIHHPASAEADAARALRRAELERRPVVLNLPIDLQAQSAADAPAPAAAPLPRPPGPADADVRAAADVLAGASRPVIIAGRGAVLSGAGAALVRLADRCGALLATSAVAKGLFASHPFDLGISGGFATPLAMELLPQADAVLAFGAGLNRWTTRHGSLLDAGVRIVQVDVEAGAIAAHHPVELGIVGDASAVAAELDAELGRRGVEGAGFRTPELAARIASERWRDVDAGDGSRSGVVDPRALTIALDELLPADRAVVVDSGHFTGWPSMYLDVPDAGSWHFVNAFQAVGLALGWAIGVAVASPERVTVAAVGDGGLFLALQELDTAVRAGARLLALVYDDAAYGAEVHHFAPAGRDVTGARFPDTDLAAVARALGAAGAVVRSDRDLEAVAAWVRSGTGPLLVDAKVDPDLCAEWLEDAFRAG
jgi:thiamine pyrophosphate-dependent acetolactate synthase large subunit-like protein